MELNPSQPSGSNNACEIHPESCLALKTLFLKKHLFIFFRAAPAQRSRPLAKCQVRFFPALINTLRAGGRVGTALPVLLQRMGNKPRSGATPRREPRREVIKRIIIKKEERGSCVKASKRVIKAVPTSFSRGAVQNPSFPSCVLPFSLELRRESTKSGADLFYPLSCRAGKAERGWNLLPRGCSRARKRHSLAELTSISLPSCLEASQTLLLCCKGSC